jgi:hypothetical protein
MKLQQVGTMRLKIMTFVNQDLVVQLVILQLLYGEQQKKLVLVLL